MPSNDGRVQNYQPSGLYNIIFQKVTYLSPYYSFFIINAKFIFFFFLANYIHSRMVRRSVAGARQRVWRRYDRYSVLTTRFAETVDGDTFARLVNRR